MGALLLIANLGALSPAWAGMGSAPMMPRAAWGLAPMAQIKASAQPMVRLLAQPAPAQQALPAFAEKPSFNLPQGFNRLEQSMGKPAFIKQLAW